MELDWVGLDLVQPEVGLGKPTVTLGWLAGPVGSRLLSFAEDKLRN